MIDRRTVLSGLAAAAITPAAEAAAGPAMTVFELRQYTMQPGRRDELIALFDREFVETQEAVGATVIGQFRDLDRPDFYVWMRGFADMDARKAALEAFYFGPVWKAHRVAANATIVDSDNVLLLKRLAGTLPLEPRAPVGTPGVGKGIVVVGVHRLSGLDDPLAAAFERSLAPRLARSGAKPIAAFVTEPSPNTFARLPVREGETVLVWIVTFPTLQAADAALARARAEPALQPLFAASLQTLRLQPTARSRLHG